MAGLLHDLGLRPGDPVLVAQPMSAELYVALTAILRLGLVALFADPALGLAHLERCCALASPRALIASPRAHLLRLLVPAVRRIPLKLSTGPALPGARSLREGAGHPARPGAEPRAPDSPALLTFTSGATGQPKGAVRSHGLLVAQYEALRASLDLAPGQVALLTLPVFVLANLAGGVTSVLPDVDLRRPGAADAARIVAQVTRHRPDRVLASPALLERVADHCARQGATLPGLRRIVTGGAPVFPRLLRKLARVAPGAEVVALYGATEAEPIARLPLDAVGAEDLARMAAGQGLLAGTPERTVELRVLPDRWGRAVGPLTAAQLATATRPPGQPGEIVVAGPHVVPGYAGGHGDAETKIRVDGQVWHRTGDAGYLDGRGRLWLLGRCAARLDDARGRLYPLGVETLAAEHPGVGRAGLVACRGRRVLAVELSRPDADLAALRRAVTAAGVDEVRVVRRVPVDRRHHAKVDYPELARQVGG